MTPAKLYPYSLSQTPHWHFAEHYWRDWRCNPLRSWLVDQHSTTTRLHRAGFFRVDRLAQGWSVASHDEMNYLSLDIDRRVWVREVCIYLNESPVMFARSVFPQALVHDFGRKLLLLGNQSLGSLLYRKSSVQRILNQYARLNSRHYHYQGAVLCEKNLPSELWGRRSQFISKQGASLVSEVFLPALAKAEKIESIVTPSDPINIQTDG